MELAAAAGAERRVGLPELAAVHWRELASETTLRRADRRWTFTTAAHTIPLVGTAALLAALNPVTIPVGLILVGHAWAIPELYANRGAKVARTPRALDPQAEGVALGLLGDLLDHRARDLHGRTGMAVEPGRLGIWLLAPSGAILIRPGGRRAQCYCVGVRTELPPATGPPTSCWPCGRTRRDSPRWPTSPSPARPGAFAGASRPRSGPPSRRPLSRPA